MPIPLLPLQIESVCRVVGFVVAVLPGFFWWLLAGDVAVQPFAAIAEAVGAFYCFNIACRLRLTSPLLRLPLLLVLLLPAN